MRNFFKNKYLLLLVLLLVVAFVYGQDIPPPNPNRGPGLPIDGGIFLLSIIALAYGVSKKR